MKSGGYTVWLTGLPSSGKTTTALALIAGLRANGELVELIDGDEFRQMMGKELGFSREDRMENIRRAVYVCQMLNRNGVTAVVSMITPYHEMREYAREQVERYVEVYVKCPLAECIRRDVKGLYARAQAGEIASFTGLSDTYEEPLCAELTIHTDTVNVEDNVKRVMDYQINKLIDSPPNGW